MLDQQSGHHHNAHQVFSQVSSSGRPPLASSSNHGSSSPHSNHNSSSGSGGRGDASDAGHMSLAQQMMSGSGGTTSEEKDATGGFEFTRRKKWPQLLLQELVECVQFCLIPIPPSQPSAEQTTGDSDIQKRGWKILYVSPGTGDLLGRGTSELEGGEFFDLVFGPDHDQLHSLFNALITNSRPPYLLHHSSTNTSSTDTGSSSSSDPHDSKGGWEDDSSSSHTVYVRMLHTETLKSDSSRSSNVTGVDGNVTGVTSPGHLVSEHSREASLVTEPKVWELIVHATGVGRSRENSEGDGDFGPGNGGTVVPSMGGRQGATGQGSSDDNEKAMKGRAIWVMGRKILDASLENDGNGNEQSRLDSFLELKLENERLRAELRELQMEIDYDMGSSDRLSYDDSNLQNSTYNPNSDELSSAESDKSSISRSTSPGSSSSFGQTSGQHQQTLHPPSGPGPASKGFTKPNPSPKRSGPPKARKIDKEVKVKGKKNPEAREKKKSKKEIEGVGAGGEEAGDAGGGSGGSEIGSGSGGGVKVGGKPGSNQEGSHVCVTCGRTDSPEWRKGPLGPKTLCNACGLRWAKRNAIHPSRKDKKAAAENKK